jgi:hypothetical protein
MGPTTFLQMSEAVRDLVRIDVGVMERIGDLHNHDNLFDLEGMWARGVQAREGAEMLAWLGPFERAARELLLSPLIQAGAIAAVAAPLIPSTAARIAVGDTVLIAAEVRKVVLERGTLLVRLPPLASGLITYTPVPLTAVRQVLASAALTGA